LAKSGEALNAARQLLSAGELDTAERLYRQLVETDPHAAEPWHELGILLIKSGRREAAVECLCQAVTLDPSVPDYSISLASAYRLLNRPQEAITSCQAALKQGSPSAELLNSLALSWKELGQTDASLSAFDELLRLHPRFSAGHFNRGKLLLHVKRLQEAAASFQCAIDLQPSDPFAQLQLGLVHYTTSRSNAFLLNADNAGCTDDTIVRKQAHLARAIACYRRALELKPDFGEARRYLDFAMNEQRQVAEAAEGCRLSLTLFTQKKLDEAADCLQRVLAEKPDFVEAHYRLGMIWAKQQQVAEAIVCYRHAIAFAPGHAEAVNLLAEALMTDHRPGEAVDCLSRVLNQKPDFDLARQNLELAAAQCNQRESALESKLRGLTLFRLQAAERRVYSQNGEDGVIESLFAVLGTTNKFFVEFGCGDGLECNGAHLLERGWTGLQMDAQARAIHPRCTIRQEFVTAENVNQLFAKHDVPAEFDLLSIDMDGNDFWVWRQITSRPRVVVIEYNASLPPHERGTIPYDPTFSWNGTSYFGASMLALQELGQQKGYTLVYCERAGVNAFFVANEVLPEGYKPPRIEEIYRLPNYSYCGIRHPAEPKRKMIDPFAIAQ